MKCPNCGTNNAPGEEFCSNCGASLDPTATNATIVTNVNPTSTASAGAITLTGSGGTGGSRTLTPGARLENGRYVIEKVLGQGGMGAALLAKDTRVSNKLVVIKELISDNTDPTKRQEDVQNFAREVETLADLDHPLIPNVTDSFQEGTHYFMVQEYVPGENLEERMERVNQPMPEQEALTYASQILDILDYLEQQKPPIVHRDIKPANIIISSRNKRAYLVDFGIARADVAKSAKRKQTSALGTPGYAPPEQYQGNADPRSDLYALAATLHHLLTNRDPRNYPPFAYPPARSLNPRLSPEIEQILNRALMMDITKRYQNAAAMKHDIDEILTQRFGVGSTTSTYTFGGSGSIGPTGATATVPGTGSGPSRSPNTPIPPSSPQRIQPRPIQQPAQARPQQSPLPRPAASPYQSPPQPMRPQPVYAGPAVQQQRRGGLGWVAGSFLLLLVVALIAAALFLIPGLLHKGSTSTNPGVTPGTTPTVSGSASGIGVTQIGGEPIGISDGSVAFDTSRTDGNLKMQAANSFKQGDSNTAANLWNQAAQQDTSDAEALIYQENQRIVSSGSPYITVVVGTMLTGGSVGIGRDDLQGAYVAQKEWNDGAKLANGMQVRLLIANAGSKDNKNAAMVARQIVQLAQSDKTFVGVMGWPFSGYAISAVKVLSDAHIPMVSQTASSDELTGTSPYFFRVAPSNKSQGIAGARYAEQTLHAKNVALFVDNKDPYSSSLAKDFSDQFKADGNSIVVTEPYTIGPTGRGQFGALVTDALKHNPDLIYFSGYADDVSVLLTNLPSGNIMVMGGDALYELAGYNSSARANFSRLRFTAFSYPDEWQVLGLTNSSKMPAFFREYPTYFNPNNQSHQNPYGYTRADTDATLSYDGMVALLTGYNLAQKTTVTPSDLQQGLTKIQGANAIQGASGQIAFGSNGDPINKAIVILRVSPQGFIQMESVEGTFLTP